MEVLRQDVEAMEREMEELRAYLANADESREAGTDPGIEGVVSGDEVDSKSVAWMFLKNKIYSNCKFKANPLTKSYVKCEIDLIHKWLLINDFLVFMLIILTSLTSVQKLVLTRLVRMISTKTKE